MAWRLGGCFGSNWLVSFTEAKVTAAQKMGRCYHLLGWLWIQLLPVLSLSSSQGILVMKTVKISHVPCPAHPFRAWRYGWVWDSWVGLGLFRACINWLEYFPFWSCFPVSQERKRRFGNSHWQVMGWSPSAVISWPSGSVSQLKRQLLLLYQGAAVSDSPTVALSPGTCVHRSRWPLSTFPTCWETRVPCQTLCLWEMLSRHLGADSYK